MTVSPFAILQHDDIAKAAQFAHDPGELFADDLGVVPDTGADLTTNLADALDYAASVGKRLVLLPGEHRVRQAIVPAGTDLRGVGPATVLKRLDGGDSRVLQLAVGAASSVKISDLTIDGNAASGGTGGGGAIDSNGNSDVEITNVTIVDALGFGIRLMNGSNFAVRGCTLDSPRQTGIVVQCSSGGDQAGVTLTDNVIDRSALPADSAQNHGIMCRGSDDGTTRILRRVVIANNRVRNPLGSTQGICIETWSHQAAITGNVCEGGVMGISTGMGIGVTIAGNTCANNNLIGIECIASGFGTGYGVSQGASITGNTVEGGGVCHTGISSTGVEGPDELVISSNCIRDTISAGIHVLGPPRSIVSNNYISWDGSAPASTNWGIRIQSIGRNLAGPARIVCNGNFIDGNTPDADARGIQFQQTNATSDPNVNIVCSGNLIVNVNDGIFFAPTGINISGTCVGNSIESANVVNPIREVVASGGTVTLAKWANRGAIPSRAAYASTDALLIAQGVIVA